MTLPDLTYKINNELLPKIVGAELVISGGDIFELIDILRSNVALHQLVSDERGSFISEMCDALTAFAGIIKNRCGNLTKQEITAIESSAQSIILKAVGISGELAYSIAAKELADPEHPNYTNRFTNTKFQ